MGLYGETEGMSGSGSGEFGEPHEGPAGQGEEQGATASSGGNPDVLAPGENASDGTATSASEAGVPLRYRRAVRQYFQRLSEELGDRVPAREAGPGASNLKTKRGASHPIGPIICVPESSEGASHDS